MSATHPKVDSNSLPPADSSPVHIKCLGFWADYDRAFFNSAGSEYAIEVIDPAQLITPPWQFQRWLRVMREHYYIPVLMRYIEQHPDDFFIFGEHRIILRTLVRMNRPINGVLVLRNPISKPQGTSACLLKTLHQRGCRVATFDPEDSKKFGFDLYPQFIAPLPEVQNIMPEIDFGFVGRDKGRQGMLKAMAAEFDRHGYRHEFHVIEHCQPNLSYVEYLQLALKARCMLDLVQCGQSGMTLRPLEAMIYRRKLITNNPTVLTQPFYHPNNILFISSIESLAKIHEFLNIPMHPTEPEIFHKYMVTHLIKTHVAKNCKN